MTSPHRLKSGVSRYGIIILIMGFIIGSELLHDVPKPEGCKSADFTNNYGQKIPIHKLEIEGKEMCCAFGSNSEACVPVYYSNKEVSSVSSQD